MPIEALYLLGEYVVSDAAAAAVPEALTAAEIAATAATGAELASAAGATGAGVAAGLEGVAPEVVQAATQMFPHLPPPEAVTTYQQVMAQASLAPTPSIAEAGTTLQGLNVSGQQAGLEALAQQAASTVPTPVPTEASNLYSQITDPSKYMGNQPPPLAEVVPQTATPSGGIDSLTNGLKDAWKSWSDLKPADKALYAMLAGQGISALTRPKPYTPTPYTGGDLAKFRFDRNVYQPYQRPAVNPYQPTYNTGGIVALGMGGVPPRPAARVNPMQAIDSYVTQASASSEGMQQVLARAQAGDYNAMLALNKLRGTPNQNYARGGISDLGGYSDGGRLLRGPGDGVSDSIPATIGNRQPARLADGEFVVPARIVSELGNGSTEAGARKLYAMMDRVQRARGKTTAKGKVAKDTSADKYLPA